MYQTLITKIGTTLAGVTLVKDYFMTPKTKLDEFPCVFYKPGPFDNNFETVSENAGVYRFLMLVMVGANGTTIENAFSVVLPKVVDAIIAQFNAEWDQGTIDGHRVRVKIDSASDWEVSEEQDGLIAYAPLNVEIRLLSDI